MHVKHHKWAKTSFNDFTHKFYSSKTIITDGLMEKKMTLQTRWHCEGNSMSNQFDIMQHSGIKKDHDCLGDCDGVPVTSGQIHPLAQTKSQGQHHQQKEKAKEQWLPDII